MMDQKKLIADRKDVLLTQLPLEQPPLELPSRITLPERIFLTRKFDPTFCTCGKHCLHEPQYHMERTVFRLGQFSGPSSAGDLEVCVKEKLKSANLIIESTEVEGEDEANLFHNKKIEFVRELVSRLRDEDVHRLQDYFGKEGRITFTGFDGVLLCRQRKRPNKTNIVKEIKQKSVSREGVSAKRTTRIHQVKKTATAGICQSGQKAEEHEDIGRCNESKSARLFDKSDFNKEMADTVQAYEAEYEECKETDKESVPKRADVTDAFDSDFAPKINFVIEKPKSELSVDERIVGYVPCLSTAVCDDDVDASDISKSKINDQTDMSGLFSKSIVVPDVTCDCSHQLKGIVPAYEAEYAETEEIHDRATDIIDPFETNHDDFELEPDYSLLECEEGDNTGDNKTVLEIGQAKSSCPFDDGRQEAEAKSFMEASHETERITPVVKEPTTFHSENHIYEEISDIVRAYEAEVDESKEVDEGNLSGSLDTVHSSDDDGESEATLKHAFFISAMKTGTSVIKKAAEDIDCFVNTLNEATKTTEASYSAGYTDDQSDIERSASRILDTQVADDLGNLNQDDSEATEENYNDELPEDLRQFTPEVASNNLPIIACYGDDDNGISPCFGILAIYCESEIHASWGGTKQGLIETVKDSS